MIATDGNLSRRPYRITITSNDLDLLEIVRQRLNVRAPIRPQTGGYGHRCHCVAWSDRSFYLWLLGVGLTPAKSLTLGPLAIPDEYFADFFRGSIDGDGSIVVYDDRYNAARDERYVYERLYVSLVSASRRFLDWVQSSARRLIGIHGSIMEQRSPGKHSLWKLRYAKQESINVLRWMYYAPDVPCLARKRVIAERFLQPLGHAPGPPLGRPRAGWLYNEGVAGKNFENAR